MGKVRHTKLSNNDAINMSEFARISGYSRENIRQRVASGAIPCEVKGGVKFVSRKLAETTKEQRQARFVTDLLSKTPTRYVASKSKKLAAMDFDDLLDMWKKEFLALQIEAGKQSGLSK